MEKMGGVASEKKSLPFHAFLCALALTGCLLPGMAEASFKGGNGAVVDPNNSIAVGDDAQTAGQYTVALGSRTRATNIYAIAIGDQAKATGQGATAIGSLSLASALHSLAVGDQAHATGQDSSAYGLLSDATGVGSVALGTVAKANSQNAIAIGNTSTVTGLNAIGIGSLANAAGTQTVVVGRQAHSDAASENSVAIGQGAHAGGQKRVGEQYSASTIAIGNIAYAAENGDIVIGRQATSTVSKYHGEDGSGAVVMGSEAHSYGSRGDVVLGSGAEANIIRKGTTNPADAAGYSQSIAIGSMAKVYGTQAMAIGGDVKSIGHSSIAIGGNDVDLVKSDLQAAVPGFWAAGAQNKFERETAALYPGTTLGSAALSTSPYRSNTASIGAASIAMGAMTQSFGIGSTAIGVNSMSKGAASTSIGVIARSWGKNSLAIGSQAGAYGDKSTSLGDTNTVGFDMTDGTTSGAASSAVGTDNKVYGNNSYAIGGGNTIGSATITETTEANGDKIKKVTAGTVKGSTAGAFGYKNTITTDNAYVVGNNSTASADGAMILGSSASVTGKNGVALGNNTKVANENAVAIGNGSETAAAVATPSATINGVAHNFAGVNPASTVSVGKAGSERTITNVAAGRISATSTDAINGSQLYAVTSEVDKGLRFDADNNSEKTNKLGSKVTVNGDNNITTEITQTGDDTKIGVKLNQDINVKTVTATDTVKAGGVTMGGQTVANAAGANETGNYVTGLDNKTWNIQNPNVVSGRGATEDQLKVVSDEVKKQGANATDYRLVQNASSADGSYTVDTNGDIDLTVEDKNHAGQKETVKLKDIASKSKLDDVINKGLQFDANVGGVQTNKLGSKITVKGEGTAADTDYSGENLKTFITQDPAGNTTIDVKMNKNLKVETVVATGENGKDGKIGINGKDGQTTNISVTRDGKPGVDGAPGTTTTRIVYEKPDGTKEEVATLNDGMKYGGDTGAVIKKKLNEQVNVVGGIRDESKLTTDDNIGVVSDGTNNLKVRLAKALKGLESVTTGDTVMNNNGVTINNGAAGNTVSLTKNGLDNGGNKITNVAAGVNGTDAVNVNQLNTVAGEAAKHTTVKAKDSNVTITEGTNAAGGTEYTIGLGDKVTLGSDPSKQVSIDGTTGIIKAGDKVTIDGTTGNIDAGKVKINGKDGTVNELTNKTWDPNNITSGQAATEDQLKEVDNKITNTSTELTNKGMDFAGNDGEFHRNLGEKVTIKGEGTKAASEYSGENIKTFADSNGNLTVKMDKNLKTETIVAAGKDGKNGKIGINGNDGQTTNISVTSDGKPGVDGAPGTTTTRIVYEKPDGTKEEVATLNDGMKYGGDTGAVIKKKLNEQVNVVGGITDTNKLTTEDNLGVVSDGNNNLKVRMAKDLKGLNSVTTNTLTVGDVKIDNSGINAGNKKITNVAAGDISANSTDAVNGGQLWKTNQTINNIGGAVNELGTRVNRVGAGAAALAALHPLDFDPDDKWDVAAGYGNYKDAHAVSVGAFYRPNEDTMFSVGGSFGGGENMVNAGVSVKLGQGNHVSTSRVALAKEVEDLKAIVKAQSAEIKAMRGAMQSGTSVMKDVNFPDVPKDHWAYSYVKSLADRGLLEGYPDGEFKGDRTMTRYEFAAIIYRALQNGAPIDSDMAKAIGEFDPEINRIKDLDRTRVDRISGKDNDRHKVERVRVNNESNKEKGDYRDVYGSHISPEA